MTKCVPFTKMHGLGNDFILVEGDDWPPGLDNHSAAASVCHRRFGVGADGLIIIVPSEREDCQLKWLFYNSDGSDAEMCGNGMRCLTRYVLDKGIVKQRSFGVETLAGRIEPRMQEDGCIRVDMGEPIFRRSDIPMIGPEAEKVMGEELEAGDRIFTITALSMGNPHCVSFIDDLDDFQLEKYGPLIENHPSFPNRVNAEFARVVGSNHLRMRIWERGAGITLASGTGSCAVAIAGMINGLVGRRVTVSLPGGDLELEWEEATNRVFMTGPAEYAFTGEIDPALLDDL